MESLAANPAFRTYALCSAILAAKLLYSSVYTGTRRTKHQAFINPEDARVFGQAGTSSNPDEAPAVAHALRIQRNDLENIPAFFAIGLVYVLLGASPRGAAFYCWAFTIARVTHTVMYTRNIQPWRAIAFGVGAFAMTGMIVQILRATL